MIHIFFFSSKNQVFNDNFIWEALYRRHKRSDISQKEKEYAMAYGWKQTFKEKQMPFSMELRKVFITLYNDLIYIYIENEFKYI